MTKEQRDFCAEFEAEQGDPIVALTLARFCGTDGDIGNKVIEMPSGLRELWGLLLVGKDSLHFYVHASGNSVLSLLRGSRQNDMRPRQYCGILYPSIAAINVPQKKRHLLSRLFVTDTKLTIVFDKNGKKLQMHLLISESPDTERVLSELQNKTPLFGGSSGRV